MSFNFCSDKPIYLQIVEHIKMQIIRKEYQPNDKLPSVRDYSIMFNVNPNTVQKALAELENIGLIYTERTNGKFITNNESIINNIKTQTMNDMINSFFESMKNIGINENEVLKILNNKE